MAALYHRNRQLPKLAPMSAFHPFRTLEFSVLQTARYATEPIGSFESRNLFVAVCGASDNVLVTANIGNIGAEYAWGHPSTNVARKRLGGVRAPMWRAAYRGLGRHSRSNRLASSPQASTNVD